MVFVEWWIVLLRLVTSFVIGISYGCIHFLFLRETNRWIERLNRQRGS